MSPRLSVWYFPSIALHSCAAALYCVGNIKFFFVLAEGLPILVKDLTAVKGLPFTLVRMQSCCTNLRASTWKHADGHRVNAPQGSRIYRDNIAKANDALIDVLEDSGAIVIGKTNTPEFGAGANTFN